MDRDFWYEGWVADVELGMFAVVAQSMPGWGSPGPVEENVLHSLNFAP